MTGIDTYIKQIEAATSGAEIRTEIVNALNFLNSNVTVVQEESLPIPEATIKSICTR